MNLVRIGLWLLALAWLGGCQSSPPRPAKPSGKPATREASPPPPNPARPLGTPSTPGPILSPETPVPTNPPPAAAAPAVASAPATNAVPVVASTNAVTIPTTSAKGTNADAAINTPGSAAAIIPFTDFPEVDYSAKYDTELKYILSLAKKGKWEEAEAQITVLARYDPQDEAVLRVKNWIIKQRELQRAKALEDKIRTIDSNNSVFNPTLLELLSDQKDRGLPPRKDVRDAVDAIQSVPYVPPSYGKTITQQGELFDFATREGRMARVLEKEISVHLDNVTLEAIIFNIGQAEGINFVADKSLAAFKQNLSVNMDKVRLAELLQYISRNLDLQFQIGSDLIWIVDGKDPKKLMEETRFYKLRKGFILPASFGPTEVNTITQVTPQGIRTVTESAKIDKFVNDNAPEKPTLETVIKEFFTGTNTTSKYLIDYERNVIVAKGTRDQLQVLESIIQSFDKPVQQVLIEARFITVTEAKFLQLGVLWETGRSPVSVGRKPTDFTGLISPQLSSTVGLGIQETWKNVLNSPTLSATLSAIQQDAESQTLSAPRLTLINNRPANIQDGKIQYYYEEYQVKTQILEQRSSSSLVPSGKPTKLTAGVTLDVLASIGGDGQTVLLALRPKVNTDVQLVTFATVTDYDSSGKAVSTFDIKLPEYRTQELATRVSVKSGETVVMGGVLERNQGNYVESVPVLGNLPLIGGAFRRRTQQDKPRYLLIFVTATLLSDTGEYIVVEPPTGTK